MSSPRDKYQVLDMSDTFRDFHANVHSGSQAISFDWQRHLKVANEQLKKKVDEMNARRLAANPNAKPYHPSTSLKNRLRHTVQALHGALRNVQTSGILKGVNKAGLEVSEDGTEVTVNEDTMILNLSFAREQTLAEVAALKKSIKQCHADYRDSGQPTLSEELMDKNGVAETKKQAEQRANPKRVQPEDKPASRSRTMLMHLYDEKEHEAGVLKRAQVREW